MATDVGDLYRLSYDHYVNGVLATAGAATWTLTLPDATTSVITATTTGTGLYRNDYPTVQAGLHRWRWVGTGANPGAQSGSFYVSPEMVSVISLEDARAHLNITRTVHDEELRPFLEAATEMIEIYTGEVVPRRSVTEFRRVRPTDRLSLFSTPVISLTTVATVDGLTTWNVGTDLHLDPELGLVTVRVGKRPLAGHLQLVYVAGYLLIPARYTMAGRELVKHLWSSQRGSKGGPRVGGVSVQDLEFAVRQSMPPEVADLLGEARPGIG